MNKIFISLFFICAFAVKSQTQQALFIGNSMTYFNNMPEQFKNIALSKGKTVDVTSHTAGGAGFVHHINDAAMYQVIRSKVFDFAILQPGTSESAGASFPVSLTAERGRKIRDSIKKYSPCAKVFLYEIPYGVPSQNDYATYFNFQGIIKDSITKMANLMQAEIIPAGESARAHYTASQDLALHGSFNDIHPNLNGSYLVAASVYATLYQETSLPSTYLGGLPQNTAEYDQQISGNTVLTNPAMWLMNVYHINAGFSASGNNQQITFTNTSSNYDTVLWNFGDGSTSVAVSPGHQYATAGSYTVTLTVYKNGCSSVISKIINTSQLMVSETDSVRFKVYPNPASDFIFYESDKSLDKIEIYDLAGRRLKELNQLSAKGKIDINAYPKGSYVIRVYFGNKEVQSVKILKK
ncbi:T9SS type A sorting domain-containing protein [Chryseobacterium tongliaoense]|uniref:T9SS type A sorting domain-containing protein n=1 Tax=Chryseobacterium tongliaoense TaxID=3240933 RepID=UPI0035174820